MTTDNNNTPSEQFKVCTKCQIGKTPSEFYRDSRRPGKTHAKCRQCCQVARKAAYDANPERHSAYYANYRKAHRAEVNAHAKARRLRDPISRLLARSKCRAKKVGLEFSITAADISSLPTHCPVLGIPLRSGVRSKDAGYYTDPCCYSIDRIDSSKGYVPGNVAVMSFRANSLKNDATPEEIALLYNWITSVAPSSDEA